MLKFEENVMLYKFNNLAQIDFINHCFSTKIGGVSKDEFSSLNLGYNRGDMETNVMENYRRLFVQNGFSGNLVSSKQVHGKEIYIATKDDINKKFNGYDGFITNERKVLLTTYHADCIPVFFCDIEKRVIGLAHSGWKGTLENISIEMVKKMENNFNSNRKDIRVGIGPAICLDCFEVDEDVYDLFKDRYDFLDKYSYKKDVKYYIDLKHLIKENLNNYGLDSDQIEISNLCTKCRSDLFYSHRRDGIKRGSMAAFMEIG